MIAFSFLLLDQCLGQVTILSESFEGNFPADNGWSVGDSNTSGAVAYWDDVDVPFGSIGRAPDDSGWIGYCAGVGHGGPWNNPTYQDNMDSYMSRTINLSGYTSATLTFWYAIPDNESCCDGLEVYIDNIVAWSTSTPNPGYWNRVTVDLNGYAGSSHTLKFNFHSDFSVHYEGAYLDNILVTATTGDPNDQISEADSLGSMTDTLQGTGIIDPPSDVDMWSFTVLAGQRISFDIDLPAGSALNSYIRLFNGSGTELNSSDNNPGPGETATQESYLEFTFTTDGTYYLGVSGLGNGTYNPITGNGDNPGSTGAYTLIVSPGLTGTFSGSPYPGDPFVTSVVDIMQYAQQGNYPTGISVTPGQQTWIIIHGGDTSRWTTSGVNIPRLARAILSQRPNDQVLTLDWSGLASDPENDFHQENWIQPVAQWAASALTGYGFSGSSVNLVGHSWGGNMVDELAERIPGGVNTMVALDAAEDSPFGAADYDPEEPGQINFQGHSQFSWAFHASTASSELTSLSADEALIVTNEYDRCDFFSGGVFHAHNSVVNVFSYMLENPGGVVSSLFQLNRLLAHTSGPWIPDRYSTSFSCEPPTSGYEAIITTTTDVQNPQPLNIEYRPAINPPNTPTNVSPADSAAAQILTLTLQGSAFSEPDGDTHAASQWQVLDTAGTTTVWDSGEDSVNKTNRSVPPGQLAYSATYRWQVRYKDSRGSWSGYSTTTTFTTTESDSVGAFTSIHLEGGQVVLQWFGQGLPQQAGDVTGPWSDVPNPTNPMAIDPTGPRKFYRLMKP